MTDLVSLAAVNNALRLDLEIDMDPSGDGNDTSRIDDIEAKITQASDIVLNYLKNPEDSLYWDADTTPPRIQSAVILVIRNLYDEVDQPLSEAVKNLLVRDRDPALA